MSSVIIVAQISTKIPNPFIAGMVYWLFLILVVGICVAGTGILAILIEIKVFVLSQGVYLGIRCYLNNRLGTKQYWCKHAKKRIIAGDKTSSPTII